VSFLLVVILSVGCVQSLVCERGVKLGLGFVRSFRCEHAWPRLQQASTGKSVSTTSASVNSACAQKTFGLSQNRMSVITRPRGVTLKDASGWLCHLLLCTSLGG